MCTYTGMWYYNKLYMSYKMSCTVLPYMYINYMFYVSLLYSYSPLLFLVVTVDRYLQGTNIFKIYLFLVQIHNVVFYTCT